MSTTRARAYLLVGPGFDDDLVSACLTLFRVNEIAVCVVALSTRGVRSHLGLHVIGDRTLETVLMRRPPRTVILTGPAASAQALLIDPRVGRLLSTVIAAGGFVAAAPGTAAVLASFPEAHALQGSPFILPGRRPAQSFALAVVERLAI